ncbi:MAG TPA: hypothetical protein VGR26_16155 [Acidimicrobiales bacterium]|nr:hypothetical protein [Acidimicrobiales bacterium]
MKLELSPQLFRGFGPKGSRAVLHTGKLRARVRPSSCGTDCRTGSGWRLTSCSADAVREAGWRTVDTGFPPDANDIRWAGYETTNLLRTLNLLSTGGDWQDRSYGLTPAGRAVALETLHHRAIGPRSNL